ncbi:hypothetical protein RHMOL_Rhmol10G0137500 [Rhododendron molle]|uniref:Uncharacterized protein n=1 Tax=Rhododendron molle TaxID=49168 RepID=A0ACC0M3P3_RHOML|nr:hypothetical protein RHMOL_Rhmol10G0137500 [Rhododendron molle]
MPFPLLFGGRQGIENLFIGFLGTKFLPTSAKEAWEFATSVSSIRPFWPTSFGAFSVTHLS